MKGRIEAGLGVRFWFRATPEWHGPEWGAVVFCQEIRSHFQNAVGPDPEEVAVEGHMVELAERQPILNYGLASWVCVGNDVCRIEQLLMPQPAKCTPSPVCLEHSLPESSLMQSLPYNCGAVLPPSGIYVLADMRVLISFRHGQI